MPFDSSTERAGREAEDVASGAFHNENLYDQNEDNHGEKIDLGTGKPFDNSTFLATDEPELTVIKEEELPKSHEDEMGDDPAAKWLQENDPEWKKTA